MPLPSLSAAQERRIDAFITITYTWSAEDAEQWLREHPVSMFESAALVLYNDRARKAAPKRGTCPLCGLLKDLILDHCHRHWWARGSICYSCNSKMGNVDGGYRTAECYAPKYFEWLDNCVDCATDSDRRSTLLTDARSGARPLIPSWP